MRVCVKALAKVGHPKPMIKDHSILTIGAELHMVHVRVDRKIVVDVRVTRSGEHCIDHERLQNVFTDFICSGAERSFGEGLWSCIFFIIITEVPFLVNVYFFSSGSWASTGPTQSLPSLPRS